jgi:RimJ/RimL family protein N-acetyltransferase
MPGRGQAYLVCHMLPVTGRHVTRQPGGAAATIGPVALPGYPIETARLALRPFTPDDFDDLYAYQSRPDVARYLHWEARDQAQVRQALEDQCRETSLDAEGDWLTFAVQWREAGKVVGEVGLKLVSREHRQGEVGFVFNPDYQGRGLATEAATVVLDLGFCSLGWHRIIGCCDARNQASARLMERIGMRREAHFVHSEIVKGEWADELVFAILDHEWGAR